MIFISYSSFALHKLAAMFEVNWKEIAKIIRSVERQYFDVILQHGRRDVMWKPRIE